MVPKMNHNVSLHDLMELYESGLTSASDEEFENDDILAIAAGDQEPDVVNRPDHYAQFPIEPITMIMLNGFEFWRGSIIKYASRAGSKIYDGKDAKQSEITDLQKIQRFAQMRINMLEEKDEL